MDATHLAIASFNKLWSLTAQHFNTDICFPKNPGHAADMYHTYWKQYFKEESAKTIVAVESPFKIALGDSLPDYIGRLDLATYDNSILTIVDHKTSKYDSAIILAGFECSFQTDGYLTAGNIYFDKIPRIQYNLAVCQKSRIAFNQYIIMRTKSAIDRFIEDLVHHTKELLHNLRLYNTESY
ncbi:MAG: hypothetical protein GY836_13095, partial [Herbaspirillum sp.]|uniref:hypothetical protein n=1 Tax=Herbaspirillum sp. TaxID=1890675 RepID=UPI00258A0EED